MKHEGIEGVLYIQRQAIMDAILNAPSPEMNWQEKLGFERARIAFYHLVLDDNFTPKER